VPVQEPVVALAAPPAQAQAQEPALTPLVQVPATAPAPAPAMAARPLTREMQSTASWADRALPAPVLQGPFAW